MKAFFLYIDILSNKDSYKLENIYNEIVKNMVFAMVYEFNYITYNIWQSNSVIVNV